MQPTHSAGIFYVDSGFGIKKDAAVIETLLKGHGFKVRHIAVRKSDHLRERRLLHLRQLWRYLKPMRVQVHLEKIYREQFRFSRHNLIFPNPEFFDQNALSRLVCRPMVCCKTRYAEQLFGPHPIARRYLGFTSVSRLDPHYERDFRKFLHLAGKSDYKGTDEVLSAWRRHPEWPELVVVWSNLDSYGQPRRRLESAANIRIIHERLSEAEISRLMNTCGVHICTSRTEGFGHYIMEAMSVGAVVISTDAPPMNELVRPEYGYLALAESAGEQGMSTCFRVLPEALEHCVEDILRTPANELLRRGEEARDAYATIDAQFKQRFGELLESLRE